MAISDYLEGELLDHVLGNSAYTAPATVYIGLSTADPLADGSGNAEPSGNGYARVTVANNGTNWGAFNETDKKANATEFNFPTPSGDWGGADLTHATVWDAASGGNLLYYGPLTNPRRVLGAADAPVRFQVGTLKIRGN